MATLADVKAASDAAVAAETARTAAQAAFQAEENAALSAVAAEFDAANAANAALDAALALARNGNPDWQTTLDGFNAANADVSTTAAALDATLREFLGVTT